MVDLEIKKIFDRALLGTKDKYPDLNMGKQISLAVRDYFSKVESQSVVSGINSFCTYFTRKNKKYGLELRDSILEYASNNNCDIVLVFLEILKEYCQKLHNSKKLSISDRLAVDTYLYNYSKVLNEGDKSSLFSMLLSLEKIGNLYFSNIDEKSLYDFSEIEIIDVSSLGKKILSNKDDLGLKDSYGGTLLEGKISLWSERGYNNRPNKTQQDAVLSIAKSSNCFLNVVADGVGGVELGEKASIAVIDAFKTWFESVDENSLSSLSKEELCYHINTIIKQIDTSLLNQYSKKACSTVVIALTVNDYTLIANVGDSTAYKYDDENNNLIELTTLDSLSEGLSYEEARHNPKNNRITRCIGIGEYDFFNPFVHYNFIDNDGSRIILSSDGVTDLISENRFKNYFRNRTSAKEIVNDALYSPDVVFKKEDNISAIVVDLPDRKKINGRRM